MKTDHGYEDVIMPNYPAHPDWVYWWAHDYKCCTHWWPEAPPSAHRILESMRREADIVHAYPPILEAEKMVKTEPAFKRKHDYVLETGGTNEEALDSVKEEVDKIYSRNRTNETFPEPPKRRGSEGLGYVSPVLQGRNLSSKSEWDTEGKKADWCQFFSWNAGNLQRRARGDLLNDLIASQFHLTCIQEAEFLSTQQLLFQSRGIIQSLASADQKSRINSSGTGKKVIRRLYSSDQFVHAEMLHRPAY